MDIELTTLTYDGDGINIWIYFVESFISGDDDYDENYCIIIMI